MEFLWEAHQQHRIGNAQRSAESAKDTADQLRSEVNDLKRKTEALTIASQAMWELVRERTGFTDADILAKMQEIDLRDGQADGKITGTLVYCLACRRGTHSKRKLCIYCGELLPPADPAHVFEKA